MKKILIVFVIVCMALAPHLTWSSEETEGNTIAVGVQGIFPDDDSNKFQEDNQAGRPGVFLEELEFQRAGQKVNVGLTGRFTTGRSGWLDLKVQGDKWATGIITRVFNTWYDTSFAPDILPSGTRVDELYPEDTGLDDAIGESEPRFERKMAELFLTYRFSLANRITLRAGVYDGYGERVPSIGGFSISDVGSPAFYAAGLEKIESQSTWISVDGKFKTAKHLNINIYGELRDDDTENQFFMPAFGTASLLDINYWKDAQETTSGLLAVNTSWDTDGYSIKGGASFSKASTDPDNSDSRVDETGALLQQGLATRGGDIDSESFGGALGGILRIRPWLTASLSFDLMNLDQNGDLGLFNGNTVVPEKSNVDTNRVGGTGEIRIIRGVFWSRLQLRVVHEQTDRDESLDTFLQKTTETDDRVSVRLDASYRATRRGEVAGWIGYENRTFEVDVDELVNGYALDEWQSDTFHGGLSYLYTRDAIRAGLNANFKATSFDAEPPVAYPLFDPSISLDSEDYDVNLLRIAGTLIWAFERGSICAELGWLRDDFSMPTPDDSDGYALTDETIDGVVFAFDGQLGLWQGAEATGHFEIVNDSSDLDNTLIRTYLELQQLIRKDLTLFGRLSYWDYNDDQAGADEYSTTAISIGIKIKF